MPDDILKNTTDNDMDVQGDDEGFDMSGLGDLDALLGLSGSEDESTATIAESDDAETDDIEFTDVDADQSTVFLDAVAQMSEEEIDKLLVGATDYSSASEEGSELEDSALRELEELLTKAENDELLDHVGLQEDAVGEADALLAAITGEGEAEPIDKKQQKELEKQRKKKEEKAAKKAEREATRAQKKAEKEAAKAKKKKIRDVGEETAETQNIDSDTLDGIVLGAENLELDVVDTAPVSSLFGESENETTSTSDSGLGVDIGSLFGDGEGDSGLALGALDADFATASASGEKDNTAKADAPENGKKKGFWAKLMDMLLEEEPEDTEVEGVSLSVENGEGVKEIDAGKGKKGKKGKKKAEKAEKANAEGESKNSEDADGEDGQAKTKKKAKKEKKLKTEKVPVVSEPVSKIGMKRVMPVVALGATVFAVIWICGSVSTDYAHKKTAREAFYSGDYKTCYENLFDKKLDETEEVMFGKSKSILYIRLWYREYEMLAEKGMKVEALDSLIQTVAAYPELYEYADKWGATAEVYEVYADILDILDRQYSISEVQALEIAAVKRDKVYTKIVTTLANGEPYGSWGTGSEEVKPEVDRIPDELPEESGMGQGNFVDNNKK